MTIDVSDPLREYQRDWYKPQLYEVDEGSDWTYVVESKEGLDEMESPLDWTEGFRRIKIQGPNDGQTQTFTIWAEPADGPKIEIEVKKGLIKAVSLSTMPVVKWM